MSQYLLSIDQGTTNSRAILFDKILNLKASHEKPLTQSFPHPGWVEQDPDEMYENSVECCRAVLQQLKIDARQVISIGITNQRETTIIWNKQTGKPVYPAIVWQDRRTSDICKQMESLPVSKDIQYKTGLRLDPYFSASKIKWVLDHVEDAREKAESGELLFGTVETWLLWKLTTGQSHLSDITNASRTLLYNINTQMWDEDLLEAFDIPPSLLPEVTDNLADFGYTSKELLGEPIPINAMVGDQQSAAVGQGCITAGSSKATFGTGCFVLLNTEQHIIHSKCNLLSTVAFRINNQIAYCLEGGVFSAGVPIKWLRDTLQIISSAAETEALARQLDGNDGVYMVPAFTGLGAPYWQPDARAAIFGLTRNSSRAHLARAALESVAYQLRDLLDAMSIDANIQFTSLNVDGGMVANQWLMQFIADLLQITVIKPALTETTALGAAYLAGLHQGVYQSLNDIKQLIHIDKQYHPLLTVEHSNNIYAGWQVAVKRLM